MKDRNKKIKAVKERSRKLGQDSVILEDESRREFFRFENGRLSEYDLTRLGGRKLVLRPDELEGLEGFKSWPS